MTSAPSLVESAAEQLRWLYVWARENQHVDPYDVLEQLLPRMADVAAVLERHIARGR
jgi:hypothetical protein